MTRARSMANCMNISYTTSTSSGCRRGGGKEIDSTASKHSRECAENQLCRVIISELSREQRRQGLRGDVGVGKRSSYTSRDSSTSWQKAETTTNCLVYNKSTKVTVPHPYLPPPLPACPPACLALIALV